MNKPNKTELEYFIRYSLDSGKYKRYMELYEEIERLNNIINEFNEFIEEVYNHINLGDESDEFMLVFDKWLELKGSDKEWK